MGKRGSEGTVGGGDRQAVDQPPGTQIREGVVWSRLRRSDASSTATPVGDTVGEDLISIVPDTPLVCKNSATKEILRIVRKIAYTNVNVLLLGETGVGKDIFASIIHHLSTRKGQPFVRINCAALSESVFESEVFGYERGAFTGALATKPGLFECANRGTLFLDEIGELPLIVQSKLLRAVETREIVRVGGTQTIPLNIRIIAATNRPVETDVSAGNFRQDLLFRLNSVTLTIPPLRERKEEIPALASLFLARACRDFALERLEFSIEAIQALQDYSWPGNVRELKNKVERAALLATGPLILIRDFPGIFDGSSNDSGASVVPLAPAPDLYQSLKQRIVAALQENAGNQKRAADALGMSRRTLVRWLAKLGMPRPRDC